MNPEQYNTQILSALLGLQRDVGEIKAMLLRGGAPSKGGASASGDGAVADDRDLDGQHGDPTIKYDPSDRYWNGESFKNYRFSECPPDYLDAMAKYLDACAYMAEKDSDEKKRKGTVYKRKDAARARGWAARLRRNGASGGGGGARQAPAPAGDHYASYGGNDEDIPF